MPLFEAWDSGPYSKMGARFGIESAHRPGGMSEIALGVTGLFENLGDCMGDAIGECQVTF